MEIGNFKDLLYLIDMLNTAWKEKVEYRLEEVGDNNFLFIEDFLEEDDYECGVIFKKQNKAYALSPAVHSMVMNAYSRYLAEFPEN